MKKEDLQIYSTTYMIHVIRNTYAIGAIFNVIL